MERGNQASNGHRRGEFESDNKRNGKGRLEEMKGGGENEGE